ncbi:MAG TPA: cytochrome C oxidase subunit IV family protein [Pyrinomonadaceae bacterium]|nr:cytochrome C oxidase subunit IV family protein [Pyrinomonadaceae bacterium]
MSEHIVSRQVYFVIFGALMVGTALTVLAATQDFGWANDLIAMTIAVGKALLVLLFFMHVRYSSRLVWVVVCAMFFWLAVMLVLTLTDYSSRRWFGPSRADPLHGDVTVQEPAH